MSSPNKPTPQKQAASSPVKRAQSFQEWAMAGGGIPLEYKGREHVWHRKAKEYAEGGEVHMQAGGISRLLKGLKGTQEVLPAAQREANLEKMMEGSKTPPKLYHGTGKDVERFDKSKLKRIGFGEGFHFAESPKLANFYAGQWSEGQNVIPAHVSIKNPFELKNTIDWFDVPGANDRERTNWLKSQGFDGMKYPHGAGKGESPYAWVAFEPTQIKSAIGNRGNYDMTNPDLNKAAGGDVGKGGAAFGTFPQMKPRRAKQDREAAKNVPVDLARGFVSGVLGAPGDIESFARLPYELITGKDSPTFLPTSEDIEKRLPFKSDTPVSRAATGLGQIGGGFYMGPGSPLKVAGALPGAIKHGAQEFAKASAAGAPRVIKPKGGNFLTGSVEKALDPLKKNIAQAADQNIGYGQGMSFRELREQDALNQWIDRNLGNYVKKEMATPEDPVRKLAEEGITHLPADAMNRGQWLSDHMEAIRRSEGFPEAGMARTEAGRGWENLADESIQITAPIVANKEMLAANPWLSKLDPNQSVYRAREADVSELGFDHIMDVLRQDVASGRIRPEQLSKVSMEQAVRRTYDFDQEMAKKMREAQIKATEGMPVHKEYPEGYKWIELAKPKDALPEGFSILPDQTNYKNPGNELYTMFDDKGNAVSTGASEDEAMRLYKRKEREAALESALKYEGETMGHCVGGYCPDVLEGKSRIYSLRDAKGEPHVTVEVNPSKTLTPEKRAAQMEHIVNRMRGEGMSEEAAIKRAEKLYPESETLSRITQIKGKQNRAPNEEYLPFVQDFVRSGNWSEIGDLPNTGMFKIMSGPRATEFDKAAFERYGNYATSQELDDLEKILKAQPPEGMKAGGAVKMSGGGKMGVGKEAVEGLVSGIKKMLKPKVADDAPKGVEPIVVKEKPAKEAKPVDYSPKVLESTAARFAEKIAAANPKLTAEEVSKKALTQATKKLEWERTQKPALEKRYGALTKSSYAESNPVKQQNTPEVVRERMRKANEFLDQPTEPWTPPKPELQAFDRSSIKDALEGFPGVDQSRFPRDKPSRANIEHVEELYSDPANRALIEKQIKRGLPLGGETFYASLYPVKQAVLEAGMPPSKFDQWIHGLAPASARNSIMNEMAVGQFMRDMNARGIPLTEENVAREMALYKEKFGIGLPLMPIHRQGVANVLEGGQNLRDMNLANIPTNYKIPTYGTQKAGDFANSAVLDVHEAGGHTQGSRFHPYFNEQGGFGNTEYGAGEQGLLGIAKDLGIPGGMSQAGRWFGGGELTGLKSPRGDALDLLEKQVAYTLQQKGVQPNPANVRAEVLRQIETGEGDLLPWYRKEGMPDVRQTGLQRAEGGEVHLAEGGKIGGLSTVNKLCGCHD